MSESVSMLNLLASGAEQHIVFLYFMLRLLPILVAYFFFMRLTGGFRKVRLFKPKKLKSMSTDIQTKHRTHTIGLIILGGSLGIGVISYLYVEDITKFIMVGASLLSFGFGIWMLLQNKNIIEEKVILIVGRDVKRWYAYEIPKHKQKISIQDFYQNETYIVDAIGEIILIDDSKKISKHYLYWIATNDKVDMTNENLNELRSVIYADELNRFEKYHYKKLIFEVSKTGRLVFVREKQIK